MSQRLAYVKWKPVVLQEAKCMVEVAPSRKGEETEAMTLEMQKETNEFVAGELEGDKEYTVTVSVKSSDGNILASSTHAIPLPMAERVPTPERLRVTAVKKSLKVHWDVSPIRSA